MLMIQTLEVQNPILNRRQPALRDTVGVGPEGIVAVKEEVAGLVAVGSTGLLASEPLTS